MIIEKCQKCDKMACNPQAFEELDREYHLLKVAFAAAKEYIAMRGRPALPRFPTKYEHSREQWFIKYRVALEAYDPQEIEKQPEGPEEHWKRINIGGEG